MCHVGAPGTHAHCCHSVTYSIIDMCTSRCNKLIMYIVCEFFIHNFTIALIDIVINAIRESLRFSL